MTGEDTAAPHEALYWRFGPQKAVRKGKWKLVDWRDFDTKQDSGWQLYDLRRTLARRTTWRKWSRDIVAELSAAWEQWNKRNIAPLWHGGQTEDPTAPDPKKP